MAKPFPAPDGEGPYFTLNLHGAHVGPDGVTRGQGNGITVTATPAGLARMLAAAKPIAVQALLYFLDAGSVDVHDGVLRVEVEGFSRAWLQVRGFQSNQAQEAIRELATRGWVRSEQSRTTGVLGQGVGVLVGSVYGSGDVYLAPERHRGAAGYVKRESEHVPEAEQIAVDGDPVNGLPVSGDPASPQVMPIDGIPVNQGAAGVALPPPAGIPVHGAVAVLEATPQVRAAAEIPVHGGAVPLRKEVSREVRTLQELVDTANAAGQPIDSAELRPALSRAARAALAARGVQWTVDMLAGLYVDVRPDRPTQIAEFLGLMSDGTGRTAARSLAAHALDCLADPTGMAAEIRALAAARNVFVGEASSNPETLAESWALAVLAAGTAELTSPAGAYLSSAIRRPAWKPVEPLPRLAEIATAMTRTSPAAQVVDVRPAAQAPADRSLELAVALLLDTYGEGSPAERQNQERIWRNNQRIRNQELLRLAAEHPEAFAELPPSVRASVENPF